MSDLAARITVLESENARLQERVFWLEEAMGATYETPIWLGLTGHEARILGILLKREVATKEMLLTALYSGRPDGEEPQIKIIDVFICKARKKLKAFGIEIETIWGRGYRLTPEMKARTLAIIQQRAAA